MSEDRMQKIDPKSTASKLKQSELDFMLLIEKQNLERVARLRRIRRRNVLTGCLLGVGVLSIYAYSMLAVQQERFLDDFEAPATVIEKK